MHETAGDRSADALPPNLIKEDIQLVPRSFSWVALSAMATKTPKQINDCCAESQRRDMPCW
jgi:hypothetical protein